MIMRTPPLLIAVLTLSVAACSGGNVTSSASVQATSSQAQSLSSVGTSLAPSSSDAISSHMQSSESAGRESSIAMSSIASSWVSSSANSQSVSSTRLLSSSSVLSHSSVFSSTVVNSSASSKATSSSAPLITVGSVEILSDKAYTFVDEETVLVELARGFNWAEGPVWYAKGGFLLFSDVPENTAYQWHPAQGLSTFLMPSGSTGLHFGDGSQGSNGMAINEQNELIIAQTGDRRIAKMASALEAPSTDYMTLAAAFDGERLNAPNDLTIASNGDIYFTDPTHGLPAGNQALRYQGVYRLDTAGDIQLLTDTHNQPNGVALSPAEDTLYITDSQLYAYDLASDATLSNYRPLINNPRQYQRNNDEGGFDGLHVHSSGTIFTSGPGGVWIVAPDGQVLAILRTGQRTANCTLSDDEKTLYITADSILVSVALK